MAVRLQICSSSPSADAVVVEGAVLDATATAAEAVCVDGADVAHALRPSMATAQKAISGNVFDVTGGSSG